MEGERAICNYHMPTVLYINGYRFFFYSQEGNEPAHIHVEKGDSEAKLWLEPHLHAAFFIKFTVREKQEILELAKKNYSYLMNKWNEYFGK